jgi:hypothetical protein
VVVPGGSAVVRASPAAAMRSSWISTVWWSRGRAPVPSSTRTSVIAIERCANFTKGATFRGGA